MVVLAIVLGILFILTLYAYFARGSEVEKKEERIIELQEIAN